MLYNIKNKCEVTVCSSAKNFPVPAATALVEPKWTIIRFFVPNTVSYPIVFPAVNLCMIPASEFRPK